MIIGNLSYKRVVKDYDSSQEPSQNFLADF